MYTKVLSVNGKNALNINREKPKTVLSVNARTSAIMTCMGQVVLSTNVWNKEMSLTRTFSFLF